MMKKLKITLILSFLPIFMHADGDYSMQDANNMAQAEPAPSFFEYHNRMAVFGPLHQVYERIKPDAFYTGVEAWFSPFWSEVFEAELRFGYNLFYNGRDHLTPFVGGGIFKSSKGHPHSFPAVGYGVFGFLYDHEFDSVINLGVNLKGIIGGGISTKHRDWGSPVVGFDVAVPLTFRFGHKRHWDYRFEPFDIYLHGKNRSLNSIGLRNTIGYRF